MSTATVTGTSPVVQRLSRSPATRILDSQAETAALVEALARAGFSDSAEVARCC